MDEAAAAVAMITVVPVVVASTEEAVNLVAEAEAAGALTEPAIAVVEVMMEAAEAVETWAGEGPTFVVVIEALRAQECSSKSIVYAQIRI